MWTWTLNWNEIRPDLIVGSCPMSPGDLARIRDETGATAVLCAQSDECFAHFAIDYSNHRRYGELLGLTMSHAPMRDFDVADQRRRLPDAVRALAGLLSEHHRVYAHCTAGLGRAPLVVAAYLTLIEAVPTAEAFALIKARRPGAVPSPEALAGCRDDLVRANRADIQRQAWLAYRQRVAAGRSGDAEADWLRAESAVVYRVLAPSVSAAD